MPAPTRNAEIDRVRDNRDLGRPEWDACQRRKTRDPTPSRDPTVPHLVGLAGRAKNYGTML